VNHPVRKIGVLGGGQLARMLAIKGHELGFEMHVLSREASDPAAQVVRMHHVGNPDNPSDLIAFLNRVDVATFESEFLDSQRLIKAADSAQKTVFPLPGLMGELQDRLSQKQLLGKYRLPTLPFTAVSSLPEASAFWREHQGGIVLKKRRFGYDGYGTYHVRKESDLQAAFAKSGAEFFIAEPRVTFKRELAVTLVREKSGAIITFPLVETRQVNSRCFWVKGPVRHRKFSQILLQLKRFVRGIDYVGAIAFELFDLGNNLVINEIAPRVHNSAHYSLDALSLDQFSAHILAVAGRPLPKPQAWSKGFAMVNLLGKSSNAPRLVTPEGVCLHWYGKNENRPGRKMGHLNALAESAEVALQRALKAEKKFTL
jgi:5-(carboxyamino)imidazole ribonucleotide synthase